MTMQQFAIGMFWFFMIAPPVVLIAMALAPGPKKKP